MKEKAKYPIPRSPPLYKYQLDDPGDVVAEKENAGQALALLLF